MSSSFDSIRSALRHIDRCGSHKRALAALKLAYARAEAIPWVSLPSDVQRAFTAAEMAVTRLSRLEGPEVISSVRGK